MENNVPYIVHESAQARFERIIKRLVVALIVAIILVFASNAIWLYAWCQYDYCGESTETVTVGGMFGDANYADNGGRIVNNGIREKDDGETLEAYP